MSGWVTCRINVSGRWRNVRFNEQSHTTVYSRSWVLNKSSKTCLAGPFLTIAVDLATCKGLIRAKSRGVDMAKGPVIMFLEAHCCSERVPVVIWGRSLTITIHSSDSLKSINLHEYPSRALDIFVVSGLCFDLLGCSLFFV